MITGKDVDDYIRNHAVTSYNFLNDRLEPMISIKDAWELAIMIVHNICTEPNTDFEETLKVKSNAESGTLSESNRSSEEDA